MAARHNRSVALDAGPASRSSRGRLGLLGQRLARAWTGVEDQEPERGAELSRWLRDERGTVGEEVLPRFPLARRGYDCAAVDEHLGELEQELAALHYEASDLRARAASRDDVAEEIKRIGEQTSVVLIAAHEQREEMLRKARAEADRCIADATTKASTVTSQAEARVRELEAQQEAIHRDRDRLLEDVQAVSAALASVAQSAHERIPPKVGAVAAPEAG
jgi:DivIVA domain-containing protein